MCNGLTWVSSLAAEVQWIEEEKEDKINEKWIEEEKKMMNIGEEREKNG